MPPLCIRPDMWCPSYHTVSPMAHPPSCCERATLWGVEHVTRGTQHASHTVTWATRNSGCAPEDVRVSVRTRHALRDLARRERENRRGPRRASLVPPETPPESRLASRFPSFCGARLRTRVASHVPTNFVFHAWSPCKDVHCVSVLCVVFCLGRQRRTQ